jgi:hypothetical protein
MVELPKTEAELQAYVDAQVQATRESMTKEFDNKFAQQRTKHDQEIKKLKEDAGKTAEELAQQQIREQQEKDAKELEELRAYKKGSIIREKLAKEGLPDFFKNDNRLLSAEEGDYDKVIKDIKKEYADSLPKGNQHSTIVQTNGQQQQGAGDGDKAKAEFGKALKDLVS